MSERPYLSIGEVLELLKGDFPDLSISRIRALESAGQLELERTASGYRKFYDGDIAYLRSLLNGTATGLPRRAAPSPSRSSVTGSDSPRASDDPHDDGDELPELGPNGELPGEPERRHPAAFQSLRRELAARPNPSGSGAGPAPAPPAAGSGPALGSTTGSGGSGTVAPGAGVAGSPSTAGSTGGSTSGSALGSGGELGSSSTAHTGPQLSIVGSGAGSPAHRAGSQANAPGSAAGPTGSPAESAGSSSARNPLAADPSGVSLSLDELVAATGLSIDGVRELESLGLLKGQTVFSAVYYDEDALLTCKLVAAFGTYGVEPRHLRMYKLAADREASFFEQVVTPQLRRRNADSRQSAIETLGELVKLGEQLRVVALRQVLKSSINK